MTPRRRALVEITHAGLAALTRDLGVADTARFLAQFTSGFGDYTRERDALFRSLTADELEVALRASRPRRRPAKRQTPRH